MEAKPKAAVIITDGGRVLLVKENAPDVRGRYNWVQGAIEDGETPQQAACREAREETGLLIGGLELLETIPVPQPDSESITVFSACIEGGTLRHPAREIQALSWFTLEETRALRDLLVGEWVLEGVEEALTRSQASRESA